jgi:hypothetical protein
MAGSIAYTIAVVFAAVAALYQFWLGPRYAPQRLGKPILSIGNDKCHSVKEFESCESTPTVKFASFSPEFFFSELVFHDASGLLFGACSSLEARTAWTPPSGRWTPRPTTAPPDYVGVYDPQSKSITKLIPDIPHGRSLNVHGMDVISDSRDPKKLWVYMVNHREPLDGKKGSEVGADSVIEVFNTWIGSKTLQHVATVEHPVINTPNDIVGTPDGTAFWFTNDHGAHIGFVRLDQFRSVVRPC